MRRWTNAKKCVIHLDRLGINDSANIRLMILLDIRTQKLQVFLLVKESSE